MNVLLWTALVALSARPPPPAARVELATAQALMTAGQLPEAIAALDKAEKLAPQWHEVPLLRARIRLQQLGKGGDLTELLKAEDGVDYAAITEQLKAAAADLELVLKRGAGSPDEGAWATELGQVKARITAAQRSAALVQQKRDETKLLEQANVLREQSEAQDAAERAEAEKKRQSILAAQQAERDKAEAAARAQREEQERIAAAERARAEAAVAAPRHAQERAAARQEAIESRAGVRGLGIGFAVAGVAIGGVAVTCAFLGLDVNTRVKTTTFDSAGAVMKAIQDGKTYNTISYVTTAVGGAAFLTGMLLLLTHLGAPPELALATDGRSLLVGGTW